MAGKPLKKCRAGLHSMKDPANIIIRIRHGRADRECRACSNTRGRICRYGLRPTQIALLQQRADGLSAAEIAEQEHIQERGVGARMARIRRRLGVESNTAAVAVALKLGLVTPDRSGPLPSRSDETAPWVASVLDLANGRRAPLHRFSWELRQLLDVLYAWSEPHAVSVLWAAGLIKARDVQLQREDGADARTTRLL